MKNENKYFFFIWFWTLITNVYCNDDDRLACETTILFNEKTDVVNEEGIYKTIDLIMHTYDDPAIWAQRTCSELGIWRCEDIYDLAKSVRTQFEELCPSNNSSSSSVDKNMQILHNFRELEAKQNHQTISSEEGIPDNDLELQILDDEILSFVREAVSHNPMKTTSKRIAFIHSCIFNSDSILIEIIQSIIDSGLAETLKAIIVINFGIDIGNTISAKFPEVSFYHASSDTYRYEIPTLRALHSLAKDIEDVSNSDRMNDNDTEEFPMTQILYMHTKGSSYSSEMSAITDWRNLMLYFLVERHKSCYHLLESREYDIVGINYRSFPIQVFAGNFWWTTTRHLSKLEALNYRNVTSIMMENWIFTTSSMQVHSMHDTTINHFEEDYPRILYTDRASNNDNGISSSICRNRLSVCL